MNFRDFAEQEKSFKNILLNEEPSSVTNVFLLKKYIERHGITERLTDYFETTDAMIQNICNHCYDNMLVRDIIDNPSLIDKCKNETEYEEKRNKISLNFIYFCGVGFKTTNIFLRKKAEKSDHFAEFIQLLITTVYEDIIEHNYTEALKKRKGNIETLQTFCNDNSLDYSLCQNGDLIIYIQTPFIDSLLVSENILHDSFSVPDIEYMIIDLYPNEIKELKKQPRYYNLLGYIMGTCPMIDEYENGDRDYVYNGKKIHVTRSNINGWPVYSTTDIYGWIDPIF